MVNNLFKSKWSVANCMTDRAPVHTENASEQFLRRNRTLILVHTVPEQLLKVVSAHVPNYTENPQNASELSLVEV